MTYKDMEDNRKKEIAEWEARMADDVRRADEHEDMQAINRRERVERDEALRRRWPKATEAELDALR